MANALRVLGILLAPSQRAALKTGDLAAVTLVLRVLHRNFASFGGGNLQGDLAEGSVPAIDAASARALARGVAVHAAPAPALFSSASRNADRDTFLTLRRAHSSALAASAQELMARNEAVVLKDTKRDAKNAVVLEEAAFKWLVELEVLGERDGAPLVVRERVNRRTRTRRTVALETDRAARRMRNGTLVGDALDALAERSADAGARLLYRHRRRSDNLARLRSVPISPHLSDAAHEGACTENWAKVAFELQHLGINILQGTVRLWSAGDKASLEDLVATLHELFGAEVEEAPRREERRVAAARGRKARHKVGRRKQRQHRERRARDARPRQVASLSKVHKQNAAILGRVNASIFGGKAPRPSVE